MNLRRYFNKLVLAAVLTVSTVSTVEWLRDRAHIIEMTPEKTPASPKPDRVRLTVHEKNRITIEHADGSVETRQGGTMAWRNNNPGNIVYGDMAKKMGAIGRNDRMAVFADYKTGHMASKKLLLSPNYVDLTINQAICKRSPACENNTHRLQKTVRLMGDFSGKEIIGDLSKADLDTLLKVIQKTEGWKEGKVFKKCSASHKKQTPPKKRPKPS